MNLAALSIKRPTFIMSVVAIMLIIGVVCFSKLGVDQFPNVNFPFVAVMTVYRGAGPKEIEAQISKPLEEQLATIAGVKHMTSTSNDGYSWVIMQFDLGTDIKDAEQQVRTRVSLARPNLPKDIDEPLIRRFDPSDQPILILSLSGKLSSQDLYLLAENRIKPELAKIEGVGVVDIIGGTRREIQVRLDRNKLKDHQLSLTAIAGRIAGSSQNIPVGKVSAGGRDVSFRTVGEYRTIDQIRNVNASFIGSDIPVTIGQLGEVVDTTEEVKSHAVFNGTPAIFFHVFRQSGANTVAVADEVAKAIEKITKQIKGDVGNPRMNVVMDTAKYVKMNIEDVRTTIIEGIILAIIVVFLFLGSARSTFITTIALPNSLIGSFILMYLMGFTINIVTLLALSMCVGLLIDDAIVVRENIWRHIENGETPRKAAINGTNEVTMAVIATTMTIIAVFLPVGFLSGIVGQFFREMAFTIIFAMAISLFDAMTTAPLLSAYLAKGRETNGRKSNGRNGARKSGLSSAWNAAAYLPRLATDNFRAFMDKLVNRYERMIRWTLGHRPAVIGIAALLFLASLPLFVFGIKKDFMPSGDVGFFQVTLEGPPSISLAAMADEARGVEKLLRSHKENRDVSYSVGNAMGAANTGQFFVEMVNYKKRKLSTTDMKELLRKELKIFPHLNPKVGDVQMFGNEAPFNMILTGDNLDELVVLAREARDKFQKIPGLVDLDIGYKIGKPEYQIVMDSAKTRELGVGSVVAGMELRAMVDGTVPAKLRDGDNEYDIRVMLQDNQRNLQDQFADILVPNSNFNMVKLSDVATPSEVSGPTAIQRRDRTRYVMISANFGKGGAIGNIQDAATKIMMKTKLPKGVGYQFIGQAEDFNEMGKNMLIAAILGAIFMYVILASLYESLVMPLLIMVALPMAIVGAGLFLFLFKQNLTMFSMIGMVLLMGLVAKNSILLVDYTTHLIRRGMARNDAIILAGRTRLRPILMTTIALIAGMLPLAFGLSEVGRFRQSLGVAVIGGLLSSMLLTLLVIPALYGWADDFRLWTRRLLGRPNDREIDIDEKELRPYKASKLKEHSYN